MTTAAYDPYANAMTPVAQKPIEKTYFGEVVTVDAWNCMLIKGQGKVPFDPTIHDAQKMATAITLKIQCTRQDGTFYDVDQDTVNFAKDWQMTLRSLQRVGKTLANLKGCFVQVKRKPTGEKYQDKTTGETRDRTGLDIVAVYPDAEALKVAADAFYAQFVKPTAPIDPQAMAAAIASVNKPPVAAQAAAPAVNRKEAVDMIDLLWKMAAGDKPKFVALLQAQPLLKEFHKLDQPEVIAHLGANYDPELGDNLPF